MKKDAFLLLPVIFTLFICSCTTADSANYERDSIVPETKAYSPAVKSARFKNKNSAGNVFQPDGNRQVAYTSNFTLTVKDTADAAVFIKKQAQKYDGYVVSSNQYSVVAKIPVGKADRFVKTLSDSGKLTDFAMNSEDLTDTITDLNVRLDNLKKLRTRLTALLNQAVKVEDILKVERELNRITTEIERLTAQLQNNQKRVALVTFTITLRTYAPAVRDRNGVLRYYPFLKNSLCSVTAGEEDEPLFGEVPENFINASGGRSDVFTAATADDCFLVMQRQCIPNDSTLDFWGGMIARALQMYHGFQISKSEKCSWDGEDALLISAEKNTVSGKVDYLLIIAIERKWLCSDKLNIVEFSGDQKAFGKNKPVLLEKLTVKF